MTRWRSAGIALGLALALAAPACAEPLCALGLRVRLERPGEGSLLEVCARVATSELGREVGLSGAGFGPDEGLLVVYQTEREVCLTHAEVAFALDAVFVDDPGTVVAVARDIPAGDPDERCADPVRRVLELDAGGAAQITPGDRLRIRTE